MGIEARIAQTANLLHPSVVMTNDYMDGAEFIEKMCAAALTMDNYSSSYAMLVYKANPPIKQSGVFYFKKPHLMRVEVQKGSKAGSLAILASDGKVHGHLGGALKYFTAAVAPDSDLVRAANGFPMVGTDFDSLAAYLKNMIRQGDHSRVTQKPIKTNKTSSATYVIDMFAINAKNALVLKKRIYADPQTLLPVYWEDYIDGKLWSESSWSDLKTNIALQNTFFKL